jgi:hypothetical protein
MAIVISNFSSIASAASLSSHGMANMSISIVVGPLDDDFLRGDDDDKGKGRSISVVVGVVAAVVVVSRDSILVSLRRRRRGETGGKDPSLLLVVVAPLPIEERLSYKRLPGDRPRWRLGLVVVTIGVVVAVGLSSMGKEFPRWGVVGVVSGL